MRTQSGAHGNTVQSPCAKSGAISFKVADIDAFGNKLVIKPDWTIRLLFENVNGLSPDLGYGNISWKYRRLQHVCSRLQVDAMSLVETQLNLDLTL